MLNTSLLFDSDGQSELQSDEESEFEPSAGRKHVLPLEENIASPWSYKFGSGC